MYLIFFFTKDHVPYTYHNMCDALRNGNVALLLKILTYIKDLTLCNEVNILHKNFITRLYKNTNKNRKVYPGPGANFIA